VIEDFYAAKQAYLALARSSRSAGWDRFPDSDLQADRLLTALGWEKPQPALDAKRKPWSMDVRYALPADLARQITDERSEPGRQRIYAIRGVVVARTKRAAVEAVYGDASKHLRPKTTEVAEIGVTNLIYPVAVAHPDCLVIPGVERILRLEDLAG
jgi:hypothetical protein